MKFLTPNLFAVLAAAVFGIIVTPLRAFNDNEQVFDAFVGGLGLGIAFGMTAILIEFRRDYLTTQEGEKGMPPAEG